MPLYEYLCTSCGHRFESLQKTGATTKPDCPACGSAEVEKEMSSFSSPPAASGEPCPPGPGDG